MAGDFKRREISRWIEYIYTQSSHALFLQLQDQDEGSNASRPNDSGSFNTHLLFPSLERRIKRMRGTGENEKGVWMRGWCWKLWCHKVDLVAYEREGYSSHVKELRSCKHNFPTLLKAML